MAANCLNPLPVMHKAIPPSAGAAPVAQASFARSCSLKRWRFSLLSVLLLSVTVAFTGSPFYCYASFQAPRFQVQKIATHSEPFKTANHRRNSSVLPPVMVAQLDSPSVDPQLPSQESSLVEVEVDPLVDYRIGEGRYLPNYRKRQFATGTYFRLLSETYVLEQAEAQGAFEKGQLLEIALGPKWNFSLGSFAVLLGYGQLDAQSTSGNKQTIKSALLSLHWAFDRLLAEPYFVPVVEVFAYSANYDFPGSTYSPTSGEIASFGYSMGFLLQLDVLDRRSAFFAYKAHHLENTFLSVMLRSRSGQAKDNQTSLLQTEPGLVLGVQLEF